MITEQEVIVALKSAKKTTQGKFIALAKLILSSVDGAEIDISKGTNSVYVRLPSAKHTIRLSDHSSYGTNRPTHINGWKSRANLAYRLNRAIKAAYLDGHGYILHQ